MNASKLELRFLRSRAPNLLDNFVDVKILVSALQASIINSVGMFSKVKSDQCWSWLNNRRQHCNIDFLNLSMF